MRTLPPPTGFVRSALIPVLLAGLMAAVAPLHAALSSITGTGSWTKTIDASNLTGGAGTNLTATYTSAANVITLDISGAPIAVYYKVYARYSGAAWPGAMGIAVRRSSNGSSLLGGSLITGGTTLTTLTTTDTEIFTGLLDRSNIQIEVQVSGMSVSIAPGNYPANIIFTVTP